MPESFTIALLDRQVRPGGAVSRVHQLPKASRYGVIGTEGSVVRWSGMIMSDARVKCVPNTMIMGVGWGSS